MAIPLEGRLRWRREAPFHLQMELDQTREHPLATCETEVRGVAIRVFRSDGRLALGDNVAFPLWVCRRGDEPTGPACILIEAFARAHYMEVYLVGDPPEFSLAAYEFCVLDTPSDQPVLTPEQLIELLEGGAPATPPRGPWRKFLRRLWPR